MEVETYAICSEPTAEGLTTRQVAILRFLAQGRDIADIANELGYASSTIKKEVHLTIQVCRARNRAHAVAMAIRAGII
jgi:DNA-binding NarL/FixJ family response regulator